MTANFDRTDILRTWQTFRQPGEVAEVRVLNAGKFMGTVSGYFDNIEDFTKVVVGLAENDNHQVPAIYSTINPVNHDLLARAANRVKQNVKKTTCDADITALHWLPVDLDAKRLAGISSTDGEHEAAITKAREIRRWLIEEQHWPAGAFVLADSGNGGHLNVKIDLPNLPENATLVRSCLGALDFLFTDDKIAVDTTSQNPARIWKLYGTMARKGDSTAERPHRLSRLLDVPETPETVNKAQLEVLAAMLPEQEGATEDTHTTGSKGFDPVAYCQVHNLQVHHTKSFMGGTLAVLKECIFDSSHAQTACIIGWPNGARTYRCRHHSCLDRHWKDARAVIEPDASSWAEDHLNPDEISEEELNAYSLPEGPKFECQLPKDHFLQRYMAYGFDVSDAYSDYWFAGGLVALSVVADKKLKMVLRQGVQYTNIYAAIIGKSGLGRKTTIVDKTENMICKVLPQLLPALVPTEFSPEAFTEHMSDYNHAPWIRDEAAGVLSLMKKDYMRGFKDSLMQLYDCRPFFRKLRTSQRKNAKTEFRVDDPYLNLFFATTDASLGANTEQNDTLSGFLARFLFFFPQGKKTKWMPLEEGTAQNSIFEEVVRSQLSGIAAKMGELQECTAMHFSPEAASYYTEWQRVTEAKWIASNDGFYMQIYSRLAPTVAKFVMLFELGSPDFDVSSPIRLEFMQEACRLVDSYFMPTARAIYDLIGANAEKNVIDKITAYLKNHNGKATKNEIMRNIKIKSKDFSEYLSTMIESGIVDTKIVKRGGKGRDTLYVFLVDQPKVGNVTNVDNVAIIANVEEVHSGNIEADLSTLATKATSHIVATNDGNDKSDAVEEQGADVDEGGKKAAPSPGTKSLKIIYIPKGPAGEYAGLAFNPWIGCRHGCKYQHYKNQEACYAPGQFHKSVTQFRNPELKKDMLRKLDHDLSLITSDVPLRAMCGEEWADVSLSQRSAPIFMMFSGDFYSAPLPSQHTDCDSDADSIPLPRKILELFNKYKVPFDVLTKAGTVAVQDFDLYFAGCKFWTTLTFDNPVDSKAWAPGAALPEDRIAAMKIAHERGIKTCASFEPVICPDQTLKLIEITAPFVDDVFVGKINHNREIEDLTDWPKFRADAEAPLQKLGKPYTIKEGLAKAAPSSALTRAKCGLQVSPSTLKPTEDDPGFQKFKAGMAKRLCCLCGRKFPYDLTPYFNEGKSGYICVTCHMEGPPPASFNPDSQTTLGKDEVPA